MNWNNLKEQLIPAKDWILENQSKSGAIFWDEKGKCDPWDHCECLIALAIYEEWEAFDLGINWFFNNLDQDGFIPAEFKKEKSISNHFESHHAPYVAVPLLQSKLIRGTTNMTDKNESNLKEIFNQLAAFKDSEGYYYWAKNKNNFDDNSLITASMSIFLSIAAYKENPNIVYDPKLWSIKFDRDGIDRSRFSMDFYYPFLARAKRSKGEFEQLLQEFYVTDLGVKCVKEEPWVTFAETSECAIAALLNGNLDIAKLLLKDILQFQNNHGIFPTGYQFKEKIFWPDENSTWTNAAVIIAAHAICRQKDDFENVFSVLGRSLESNKTFDTIN